MLDRTGNIAGIAERASLAKRVRGAQITGAGLSGCVIVLVRSEHREGLLRILEQETGDCHALVSKPIASAVILFI